MKHRSSTALIVLAVSALACPAVCAASQDGLKTGPSSVKSEETAPAPASPTKMKMKKPIKMHEPMTTPMAKPGMMKQDVHDDMMQKDATMKDMMEKEEQDMK